MYTVRNDPSKPPKTPTAPEPIPPVRGQPAMTPAAPVPARPVRPKPAPNGVMPINGQITETVGTLGGGGTPPAVPGGQQITSTTSTGFPSAPPAGATAIPAPTAPTPTATPAFGGAVGLTPTNPANPLTAQTITPGSLADRFGIAQQRFDDAARASDPAYQSTLRDALRTAAAGGGLGSGMLRTNVGDLANNRNLQLDTLRSGFLGNALEGSINDAWNSIGLAERQQGFQSDQAQRAFANELQRLGITDQLTNSDFQRALQTWMAGNTGGTGAGTAMQGSNQAAGNASDSLAALQAWLAARAAAPGATGTAMPPAALPPLPAPGARTNNVPSTVSDALSLLRRG